MLEHLLLHLQQSGTGGWTVLLERFPVLLGLSRLGGSPQDCVSESVTATASWLSKQAYASQFIKLKVQFLLFSSLLITS